MTANKNPEIIKSMFNDIANKYDFMNNLISLGTHKSIRKSVIKDIEIPDNAKILDCCTGTGDTAKLMEEKNPTAKIVGIDFSEKMIEIAKKKCSPTQLEFLQGDCTNLPFKNETFDIVTISFGLRNIENYEKALSEIHRVLKDGGTFMHLDFGKNFFANGVFNAFVPVMTKIFYGNTVPYDYLLKSKDEFFSPDKLIKIFQSNGFVPTKRKDFLFGIISAQILIKQ